MIFVCITVKGTDHHYFGYHGLLITVIRFVELNFQNLFDHRSREESSSDWFAL